MKLIKRLQRAYHYSVNYFKIERFFKDKRARYYVVDGEYFRKANIVGIVDMMRIETHEVDDNGDHMVKLKSMRPFSRNFTMALDPETVAFDKQMTIMKHIKYDKYTGETDTIYVTKDIRQVRKTLKNIINELIQSAENPSTRQRLYCDTYKAAISTVKFILSSL